MARVREYNMKGRREDSLFYAHSKDGRPETEWQLLRDHLEETALLAESFAGKFGCEKVGKLLGLCHDLGKYSKEFQEYLKHPTLKGPDHSSAGAQEIFKLLENIGKLPAYALAGHHAGLTNGKDNSQSDLESRLIKSIPCYEDWKEEIELPELAPADLKDCFVSLKRDDDQKTAFALSFFARILFSCVVDADRLNSEEYGDKGKSGKRGRYPTLDHLKLKLEEHLKQFIANTDINKIRGDVRSKCVSAAMKPPGFFQLTVPTGGGKTLSSMAFALNHAINNNLDRVIYVIPYTSIIEQNADVFRNAFGDLQEAVVEHHSNFDESRLSSDDYEVQAWELSTENWDAPIIITTSVQFFESLFSNRPSRCRKLHNIAKSVVILDEAQMLPVNLLYPCLRALEELTIRYKTTVVLCTATQPALEKREGFKGITINPNHEIVGDKAEVEMLYASLNRVKAEKISDKLSDEDLAEKVESHERVLCVVNSRGKARKVFDLLRREGKEGIYHLSANMCPEHRSQKLREIRSKLDEEKPCRVISTQVIEAGVDIDFPVVFREMAGLDSIAQAAGRCNREAKLRDKGKVFIFEPDSATVPLFRSQADASMEVLRNAADALSLEATKKYFELSFWKRGDQLDSKKILDKLAEDAQRLNFPFRDIAESFTIIDEYSIPVLIPWGEGKVLIELLRKDISGYGGLDRKLLRKLQRFTVNLYPKAFNTHCGKSINYLIPAQDRFSVLQNESIYSEEVGLMLEDPYFVDHNKSLI